MWNKRKSRAEYDSVIYVKNLKTGAIVTNMGKISGGTDLEKNWILRKNVFV